MGVSTEPTTTERDPLLPRESHASDSGISGSNVPVAKGLDPNHVSKPTLVWILFGLWSAVFLGALDGMYAVYSFQYIQLTTTLLSPIGSYFRQSHKSSYLGTSYLLSVCCFTPLYGRLSDILGRKGAMLLGLTLFSFGTLLCGLASSMNVLILARAIAGMGGGGIMTVSSVAVSDLIPLKHRGLFQGMANILFGFGAGIGGPLGGWINDTYGWSIPLLICSMTIVALKVNIQLPAEIHSIPIRERLRRIDWLGSLTLVTTVGCLLLGLSLKTTEDIPWSHPLVWGFLIASSISLMLFIWVEAYWSPAPVMPLRLLKQRTPMAVAISNFLVSIVSFSMVRCSTFGLYNVPLYFSAVRLVSSSESGSHLVPNSIALSLGSVFAGWLMRRTGKLYVLTFSTALMTVLGCALVSLWHEDTHKFHLWFDIVPNGFGTSSVITSTLIALISSVPKEDMAVATGISYLFRTSGQVLAVSLSGALIQAVLTSQLRQRITGPDAEKLIQQIRHNTDLIPTLEPQDQKAAVDSYAIALKAVFICQTVAAILTVLACLPIEENPLPYVYFIQFTGSPN
ncbi:hypothetical protein M422DRAFT_57657 [Sphaerobolus stellatus SS14]|nr:hypothetical protein M422DRAFT_57657 [Sphaerobolus stellatus SS14]